MKKSAGILLYRKKQKKVQVFLIHPGGPFWRNKDMGAWSIPKGEFTEKEELLAAAKRELKEEVGIDCDGPFIELTSLKQKSGKIVYAWAAEKNIDAEKIVSNTFQMEWPPKSGMFANFPEVDKGQWFDPAEARQKINPSQAGFIDELLLKLKSQVSMKHK